MNQSLLAQWTSQYSQQQQILIKSLSVGLGVLLLAASAQIYIPLPGTLVPISGQTLAVLVIGACYGSGLGALTTVIYLLCGGIGLPFFAGGAAGWAIFKGATAGYLFGFVVAAYCMGLLCEKWSWDKKFKTAWPLFYIGHTVIFFFGVTWLAQFIGWKAAFWQGFVPFIPGEIIKTTLAAAITISVWKAKKIK